MIEQLGHQRAARRATMLPELIAAMKRHHRRRRIRRGLGAVGALVLAAAGGAWIVRAPQEIRPAWPDDPVRKVEAPRPRVERVAGGYRTGLVTVIDDDELLMRLTKIDRPAGLIRTEGRVWLTGAVVDKEIDTGDGPEPPL